MKIEGTLEEIEALGLMLHRVRKLDAKRVGKDMMGRVAAIVNEGRYIDAIKEVRASTGKTLKEAKDVVDAIKNGEAKC